MAWALRFPDRGWQADDGCPLDREHPGGGALRSRPPAGHLDVRAADAPGDRPRRCPQQPGRNTMRLPLHEARLGVGRGGALLVV